MNFLQLKSGYMWVPREQTIQATKCGKCTEGSNNICMSVSLLVHHSQTYVHVFEYLYKDKKFQYVGM